MNDDKMKILPMKGAIKPEAQQEDVVAPLPKEMAEQIELDELLKEWGQYVRLKSRIRRLFEAHGFS